MSMDVRMNECEYAHQMCRGMSWAWGMPVLCRRRGYITSTPKSADFSKKQRFWPKNERASCMPGRKIGERPYLAPPKTHFLPPILPRF